MLLSVVDFFAGGHPLIGAMEGQAAADYLALLIQFAVSSSLNTVRRRWATAE
jgi:hypothetical protein